MVDSVSTLAFPFTPHEKPMLAALSLVLSVLALALGVFVAFRQRRAGRERAVLGRDLHDRALALDRRCDVLQRQLDAVELRQRIDHLQELVAAGERTGRLDAESARRLRSFALDLRGESLAAESR